MRKLAQAVPLFMFLFSACKFDNVPAKLPVLGNRDAVTKTVGGKTVTDTVYQTIPAFRFINQYGDSITSKTLNGNIYVADFFFTTCPSICPIMHRNMLKVYNEFKSVNDFKIISHTIDPKHDSVAVLKAYADKLGIKGNTWWLLQGNKEATYDLSKSYLVKRPEDNGKQLFAHDGFFILVDKQKRIRGMYDGTDEKEVEKMIADIKTLHAETNTVLAQ